MKAIDLVSRTADVYISESPLEPNHGQVALRPQVNYFQTKKKGSQTSRPDSKLPKGISIYIENKRLLTKLELQAKKS